MLRPAMDSSASYSSPLQTLEPKWASDACPTTKMRVRRHADESRVGGKRLGQEKRGTHGKKLQVRPTERIPVIVVSTALTGLRRVSLASAILSFALVVWGAVVRVNGAGMTCPEWPRCQGAWLPALDNPTRLRVVAPLGAIIVTTISR